MNQFLLSLSAIGAVLLSFSVTSCLKQTNGEASFIVSQIEVRRPELSEEETKAEGGAVNYKMYWNIGDKLALVNVSQGNRIDTYTSLTRVENKGGAGQFEADAVYSYNPTDIVFTVYPYEAITHVGSDASGYKVTVQMMDNLDYVSRSNSPMFSRNDIEVSPMLLASALQSSGAKYPGIDMKRMIGMVRVLSHVSASEIGRQHVNTLVFCAKGCSGTADVMFSAVEAGASPSIVPNSGSGDEFTVNLPNHPTVGSTTPMVEFLPVFPIRLMENGELPGFTLKYYTDTHEIGFHRSMNNTLGSNGVFALNIFEGTYDKVESGKDAVGDLKWWYSLKAGGEQRPGGFSGEADTQFGNTAGRFEVR